MLRTRIVVVSRTMVVFMERHPPGSYMVLPLLLREWPQQKVFNSMKLSSLYKSALQAVFSRGCSSPFMRLAEHLTALRTWCTVPAL